MKIKRYFAADTRKALRMVRDDLGPDALIISNRSVDDGVEILAAEDFDEELAAKGVVDTRDAVEITDATVEPRPPAAPDRETAPAEAKPQAAATTPKPDDVVTSDVILKALKKKRPEPKKERSGESELIATMRDELARLRGMMENQFSALSQGQWSQHSPIRNELVQQLTRIGLAPTLATRLVASIRHAERLTPQLATREVLALLTKKIRINGQSILDQRGAVAMIGPAGAGKTTTIAKITSQFVRKHGNENIILLSADNHRIGAHEQLLAYGELFDVPVLRAREPQEIRQIIQAVGSNSLVLIDTGSLTREDLAAPERMPTMQADLGIRNYLVLPATNQTSVLEKLVTTFRDQPLAGAIITKVDEALNLGGALTAVIDGELPVACWSDGLDVNSHLYQATAKHLVAKAVTMVNRQTPVKKAPTPPPGKRATEVGVTPVTQ